MLKITKLQRVIISGAIIILALIINNFTSYALAGNALLVAAAIVAGLPIAINAFVSIKYKIIGIDALVTTAVVGAFFIGEYFEMAAVTFLFMFGHYLEARTIEKTRSSIKSLLDMAPNEALVIRDGKEILVDAQDVIVGENIIVKPGGKIAVDGEIIDGSAYINQAPITGESVPVSRLKGETVYSGTIIESGYIVVKAEKVGDDTTFSRILEMVEEAQDKKAKTQKFLEKFSKYYTPAVMALTVIVFAITRDIELSLTLLVIACPGALVISAPVSIVAGIGNAAKSGILIKGGEIIEKLGKVKVIAFDKTGTLTIGKPQVTNIKSVNVDSKEVLRAASESEYYSEHPLAKAILEEAKREGIENLKTPQNTEIITGQGLVADFNKMKIFVGNKYLLDSNNILVPNDLDEYIEEQENNGQTLVYVSNENNLLGIISIADKLRADGVKLIKSLRKKGVSRLIMLTGDNERVAKGIANQLGLDDYFANLLPENKVEKLEQLKKQYGMTAMIGDGVNDAPALATADLGIAIGGVGSDVAMETADVVVMADNFKKISYAVGLSRATVRNMKQNIYFAIIVVFALIIGVLAKTVFLSAGMLIHELSVLLVIVNAVRLLRYNDKKWIL